MTQFSYNVDGNIYLTKANLLVKGSVISTNLFTAIH